MMRGTHLCKKLGFPRNCLHGNRTGNHGALGVLRHTFYSRSTTVEPDSKNKTRREENKTQDEMVIECQHPVDTTNANHRLNELNIQMISQSVHEQLFSAGGKKTVSAGHLKDVLKHLKKHDLLSKSTTLNDNVDIRLPELLGPSVEEHFYNVAKDLSHPYKLHAEVLAASSLPPRPSQWMFRAGWTMYDPVSQTCSRVDFPDSDALIFDVEVLMGRGDYPTMATAVSSKGWYSWCSEDLIRDRLARNPNVYEADPELMIPLETGQEKSVPDNEEAWNSKLIIGHNVGFDRSFIKEQYYLKGPKTRFLDTMSMHIAVAGLTSLQRMLYVANKSGSKRKEVLEHKDSSVKRGIIPTFRWTKKSTLNNLNDVYQLYCKGVEPLQKSTRDVFVRGTMEDVRKDFQNLMTYCANDCAATHGVFQQLWPQFLQRFPHPVTFCGMLEMGTAYLPVNDNWNKYIDTSQTMYEKLLADMASTLQKLAIDACELKNCKSYESDAWLWDLDWTIKAPRKPGSKVQTHMAGFPKWYVELCPIAKEVKNGAAQLPSKLTTQRRVVPKLLKLTWDGFPLHYNKDHGWGFLVPDNRFGEIDKELQAQEHDENDDSKIGPTFPLKSLRKICETTRPEWLKASANSSTSSTKLEEVLTGLHEATGEEEQARLWEELKKLSDIDSKKKRKKTIDIPPPSIHSGPGPFFDVVPECIFYRLPHRDGADKRVGNPLSKDFLSKIEEGILSSASGNETKTILKYSKMTSYWKNNVDRIKGQMVVGLKPQDLPPAVRRSDDFVPGAFCGAILPRLVSAGTVTRRAVEKTWLTASNAYTDRVGSELKAMVQCPPGYHFVGADVDSQEQWIAAILGDAHFAGIHGCTAFGWMNLQGNKADGTDLHSKTAALVGISRDQAKVFNYGRIYGAGVKFAEKLLMQFNSKMNQMEARTKARAMYEATKGRRARSYSAGEEEEEGVGRQVQWVGGSESHVFNKLESIARSREPRTPVLRCMISKSLQPENVNEEFMTSRINWVVQSSAVDYLHLMLVTMRWLCEKYHIDARFCISIHDEVRYLVRSEDRYRAALALQITNLLTRAMFAYRLGMHDLPQSVAFFSAVDIDTCLRKEVTMDCVTPSNPDGLHKGYNIPPGEALSIYDILEKTQGTLNGDDTDDDDDTSSETSDEKRGESRGSAAAPDHTDYKLHRQLERF